MENQIDFPKENQLEHYGVWKGREVYTVTHAEYITYKYYKPDTSVAFWIIDEGCFVADNKIVGKIVRGLGGSITVDDSVKNAGDTYYYERVKNAGDIFYSEPSIEVKDTNDETSADEILAGVYTSKLWDEI